MERSNRKLLMTSQLRDFIGRGGTVEYVPEDDGKRVWHLIAVATSGSRYRVYVPQTGNPRVFKTADALVAFHETMFPEDDQVVVPLATQDGLAGVSDYFDDET